MVASLSKLERETLKSLYRLSRDGHDAHTGALAELLVRSPGQDPHQPHHDGLRQALLGSWHRLDPEARELLQLLNGGKTGAGR